MWLHAVNFSKLHERKGTQALHVGAHLREAEQGWPSGPHSGTHYTGTELRLCDVALNDSLSPELRNSSWYYALVCSVIRCCASILKCQGHTYPPLGICLEAGLVRTFFYSRHQVPPFPQCSE